jgi:hypothetical protein
MELLQAEDGFSSLVAADNDRNQLVSSGQGIAEGGREPIRGSAESCLPSLQHRVMKRALCHTDA